MKTYPTTSTIRTIILMVWLLILSCTTSLEGVPTSGILNQESTQIETSLVATQQRQVTSEVPVTQPSLSPTQPPMPTFTPLGLAYEPGSSGCPPTTTPRENGRVTRVVDGDTIVVEIAGKHYKVRYIGIDTPEEDPPEYFARQATDKNAELVDQSSVTLIKDVSETDKYGRLLRYVFVGDVFVNYALVRLGYAFAITFPPDVACTQVFITAMQEARQERLGLWSGNP
jgi:micrococcal nuclease